MPRVFGCKETSLTWRLFESMPLDGAFVLPSVATSLVRRYVPTWKVFRSANYVKRSKQDKKKLRTQSSNNSTRFLFFEFVSAASGAFRRTTKLNYGTAGAILMRTLRVSYSRKFCRPIQVFAAMRGEAHGPFVYVRIGKKMRGRRG